MNRLSPPALSFALLLGFSTLCPCHTAAAPKSAARPGPAPPLTRDSVCSGSTGPVLTVRPGTTAVIPIARGHLNRLVTPFEQPRATTVDEAATVQVQGPVIYAAAGSEAPVSLFVTRADSEAVAISLTLVPCSLPPRDLTLVLDGPTGMSGTRSNDVPARSWEESQPYVATLTQTLRAIALSKVPPGYTLRGYQRGDPAPVCALPGIDLRPTQVLEGHHLQIVIALARNTGEHPLELNESTCASPGVAAVAAWPQPQLAPGQAVELYLAVRRSRADEPGAPRPSLLEAR